MDPVTTWAVQQTRDVVAGSLLQRAWKAIVDAGDLRTGDARVKLFLEREREEMLGLCTDVLRNFMHQCGFPADAQQAGALLGELLAMKDFRVRFRATWAEAERSSDERVAMLAASCFVGAQEATTDERVDRAILQLLPEDTAALGQLIEATEQYTDAEAMGLTVDEDGLWAITAVKRDKYLTTDKRLKPAAILSLVTAQCLQLASWIRMDGWMFEPSRPSPHLNCGIDLTQTGRAVFHRLSQIDWRAIAESARVQSHCREMENSPLGE